MPYFGEKEIEMYQGAVSYRPHNYCSVWGFYDAWVIFLEVGNTFAFSYCELFIGETQVGDIV